MIRFAVSGCLVLLAVMFLAGCQSRTEGDSSRKAVDAKVDSPTPAPTVGKKVDGQNKQDNDIVKADVQNKQDDGVVQVDARTLIGHYAEDERAADQKYKGK